MRISYQWLRDYVDLDVPAQEIADRLSLSGLEVEGLHDRHSHLETVLAAYVADVSPHPNSDHLTICSVKTREQTYQVICGAPNVVPGMFSALALVGTELPNGKTVVETEIRGVRSVGMLCSEAELLVGPDASGIMALDKKHQLGDSLKKILGLEDFVFEIGITPNRPDCLSALGVARELAALFRKQLKYPEIVLNEQSFGVENLASVQVLAPDHCPRFTARVILDVKIGPSPFWLVERLAGAGLRSINNVVDITNFVMMEMGQPLHSFDLDKLAEKRIVVRTAAEGDRFVTLDSTERILTPSALMICDGQKPVGVAGVMGGLNSEIVPDTKNVLLESAYFSPVSIRRTSKNLGLSTEASYRFERGIDPLGCERASRRAAALIAELAGGLVASGVIDIQPEPFPSRVIPFSPAKCNAFLGSGFSPEEMISTLERIEIVFSGAGETLQAQAPSFRVDLEREVDLFEEVARLVGFENIPATLPAVRAPIQPDDPSLIARDKARNILESLGLTEIITYSFIAENFGDKLNLGSDSPLRRAVRIINPLSEDQSLMRTCLAPGLFDVYRRNQSFNMNDVGLYEIGMVFFPREGEPLPEERLTVGGLLAGGRQRPSWDAKAVPVDFYDIKGVVEDLLAGLSVTDLCFERAAAPAYFNPSSSARVSSRGQALGWVGRAAGPAVENFGLRGEVFIFELDLSSILSVQGGTPVFSPLPRFPFVDRDLAVTLDREIEAAAVVAFIRSLEEKKLTDITLFDAFEGERVGPNRRSLAFRLRYRSPDRTLTDEEVNGLHQGVMDRVLTGFSAELQG
ncbi:MAG: phenylalanine--tRNA ligase subunit beta [Pseudomonadota bacterium]